MRGIISLGRWAAMPEVAWKSHDSTCGINVCTPKKTAIMTATRPQPRRRARRISQPMTAVCTAVMTKGATAGETNDSDAVGSGGTAGISRP
jgi:hypothetical protein